MILAHLYCMLRVKSVSFAQYFRGLLGLLARYLLSYYADSFAFLILLLYEAMHGTRCPLRVLGCMHSSVI